jgi:hypothetical protein
VADPPCPAFGAQRRLLSAWADLHRLLLPLLLHRQGGVQAGERVSNLGNPSSYEYVRNTGTLCSSYTFSSLLNQIFYTLSLENERRRDNELQDKAHIMCKTWHIHCEFAFNSPQKACIKD